MSSAMQYDSLTTVDHEYRHAYVQYDAELSAAMLYMTPEPRPCFTLTLLKDILAFQDVTETRIRDALQRKQTSPIDYAVFASGIHGTYSLGGDLEAFSRLIQRRDRSALLEYATHCIDVVYRFSVGMDLPLTTIALVQGNAQGGGFEAALSCNVIIAERGTELGFPEVLFNLFPGMGAYTFLRQRIGTGLAERLILSGRLYSAEELYDMGVIDILAEPGRGQDKLKEYIRDHQRRPHAPGFVRYTRRTYNRVSYDELMDITRLWVDSAMSLTDRDVRTMQRLVRAQNRKMRDPGQHLQLVSAQ